MIKYIDGDLVKSAEQYDVILHGANCFCTFGAGIALQIKNKFPEAYEADCKTVKGSIGKLGTITFTTNTTPVIVNCYTQYDMGAYRTGGMDFDYEAALRALRQVKKHFTGKKIGMPKIGCMLGGADWSIVQQIIENELGSEDVTVVNYKP